MVPDRLRALASDTRLQVGVALFVVLTFLYSVVIAGQILLWFWLMGYLAGLAGFLFALFLLVRFVRAAERLADAAERLADGDSSPGAGAPGSTGEPADRGDAGAGAPVGDGSGADGTADDDGAG
jgi:hypothetical protein